MRKLMMVVMGIALASSAFAQDAAKPPATTHDLEGKDQCMMCHKTGAMEAPKAPENHAEIPNENCQLCHASDSLMQSATEAPPAVSHDLEGKDKCLMCHKTGAMEAPKMPETHPDTVTEAQCLVCHKPAE